MQTILKILLSTTSAGTVHLFPTIKCSYFQYKYSIKAVSTGTKTVQQDKNFKLFILIYE